MKRQEIQVIAHTALLSMDMVREANKTTLEGVLRGFAVALACLDDPKLRKIFREQYNSAIAEMAPTDGILN